MILCQMSVLTEQNALVKSSLLPHSMRTTNEKSLPLCVPNEINSAVEQKREILPKGSDTANHLTGKETRVCLSHRESSVARESVLSVARVTVLCSVSRLQSGSDFLPF